MFLRSQAVTPQGSRTHIEVVATERKKKLMHDVPAFRSRNVLHTESRCYPDIGGSNELRNGGQQCTYDLLPRL